jgi:hypothetical protein
VETTKHGPRQTRSGSDLFNHGLNAKQVQVWLGHHSPAFTMSTYVHLLSDDLPASPFGGGGNRVGTQPAETGGEALGPEGTETASQSRIA